MSFKLLEFLVCVIVPRRRHVVPWTLQVLGGLACCIRKGPLGLLVFSVPFSPSGPTQATLRQSSVVSSDVTSK